MDSELELAKALDLFGQAVREMTKKELEQAPGKEPTVDYIQSGLHAESCRRVVEKVVVSQLQAARMVNRFEVIDHTESGTGRQFVKWLSYDFKVEFSLQDDGRTLKVFLMDTPSNRE